MTDAQIKNIGMYVLIAFGAAVLATIVQLGVVLSGTGDIQWRPLAATFVTTLGASLVTTLGTMLRPKAGREDISHLVSRLGPEQAHEALEDAAIKQAVGVGTDQPFSPVQVDQIASRLLELRAEHEPGADEHPVVLLPPEGRG